LNGFWGFVASISSDIVSSSQDKSSIRLKIDDIRAESDKHLGSSLARNTSVNVRFSREPVAKVPAVSDRVSHEDDLVGSGRKLGENGVRSIVSAEIGPILGVFWLLLEVSLESGELGELGRDEDGAEEGED